jgi:AcrR family transcriptional regulator
VVVAAAADLADGGGLDRLTLASVAQALGVKLPSLYKHVAGLDDLRRGIAVVALRELGTALAAAAVGRAGADALRALARTYRAYALARPGRYAASVRAPEPGDPEHEEAAETVARTVYAALAGYGLEGGAAIDGARILRSGLHGFVSLELAHGFGLPQDVDRSFERLLDALDAGLRSTAGGEPGRPS